MPDAGHMEGGKPVVPAPPREEQRYTLEEAKAHLAQQECSYHGHQIEFIVTGASEPVEAFCDRCYKKWEMVAR